MGALHFRFGATITEIGIFKTIRLLSTWNSIYDALVNISDCCNLNQKQEITLDDLCILSESKTKPPKRFDHSRNKHFDNFSLTVVRFAVEQYAKVSIWKQCHLFYCHFFLKTK